MNEEITTGAAHRAWHARDRYIRSAEHFDITRYYIRQNPVKAGLCEKAEDWPWSSANPNAWPHGVPKGFE